LYRSIVPSCISNYSREAEDALLPYFKKLSLQPDTAFFNQLIKTRALRKAGLEKTRIKKKLSPVGFLVFWGFLGFF
jgi:hypothetical protein